MTQTVTCNKVPCKYPRKSCCAPYMALTVKGTILCGTDADKNPTPAPPTTGTNTRPPGSGPPAGVTPAPGGQFVGKQDGARAHRILWKFGCKRYLEDTLE